MSRAKATRSVKKTVENTPHLFYKDRLSTFKRFIHDENSAANCTSEKLARAGFYSTVTKESPTTAKCAFCFIELEFDPEDEPWHEHAKRGETCPFIVLNQPDETKWTVKNALEMGTACAVIAQAAEASKLADAMESAEFDKMSKLKTTKPAKVRSTRKAK